MLRKILLLYFLCNYSTLTFGQNKGIRINFVNPDLYTRQILLSFDESNFATDGYDIGWDITPPSELPDDMFWMVEDKKCVIQGVGTFSLNNSYPLGLFLTNSGNIRIYLSSLENFEQEIDVFIHNTEDDTYFNFKELDFESFELSGNYVNKYRLAFEVPPGGVLLSNEKFNLDEIVIKSLRRSKELLIDGLGRYNIQNLSIYNIAGQKIHHQSSLGSNSQKIQLSHLNNQVLIATIETDKGSFSKKILL